MRTSSPALSSKGAETKERIIRTAADLFHRQGIHATSPDEIIDASATGKGQFYHYFKSKEGLVHEVLMWHLDRIRSNTSGISYEVTSWEDLERWFHSHIEFQKSFDMRRASPFGMAGNEATPGDEALRRDLVAIFDEIQTRLQAFLIDERMHHRLSSDADPAALAEFCMGTIEGAMLIGKIRRDAAGVDAIVAEALTYLRSFRTYS
jgi:AcrR family transcriptional regulator